ncbi:MAG: YfjI family protein [Pseudomonadota bacterium]
MPDATASRTPFTPAEPLPLLRETPLPASYPIEALGPLRAAAEAAHELTQAPIAIAAQSALTVASLPAQALADVEVLEGGTKPLSLFALTVAASGERKSACDRHFMAPVYEFERELSAGYDDDLAHYANARDLYEKRRRDIISKAASDPDGARADLDALGTPPDEPILPYLVNSEPTFEAVAKHLGRSRPALGLFSDEGGGFIGGHAMKDENRLRTITGLSSLWDGAPVSRARAGDGIQKFHGRRLACHLMCQPVAAAGLLGDPVANGQGFLARFLVTEPVSTIGTRVWRKPRPESHAALDRFAQRIGTLLRYDLPLREGMRNELAPPTLHLDAEARALLRAFYDKVEAAQKVGGTLEGVRPFASKAAEHAARLAGVLTIYADAEQRTVLAETMADAIKLASYYLGEAKRLTDMAAISAETGEAEKLRLWLIERWQEPFISAPEVVRLGPSSLRVTSKARKALQLLATHGWLHLTQEGATVAGKGRREAWLIHGRVGQ